MKAQKTRVLIVGNSPSHAKTIATAIPHAQCRSITGQASADALFTKSAAGRPDLVILSAGSAKSVIGLATEIHEHYGIPVAILAPEADADLLDRVEAEAGFAYLIRSLEERDVAIVVDTALRRAARDRELLARQRWNQAVLDCMGDAIIIADCSSAVVYMNPVAEDLTGWSATKAVGRPFAEVFHTIDAHNREPIESSEARALRDDTELAEEADDILLVSADGVERPIATTVAPVNDSQGNLLGIVTTFRDVTARREIEKRAINREKMEALGKLSRSIAHDFNNIIGLVAGYAAGMQEYLIPNSRAHDDARRILAAVEHAGTLSKRIMGVARASDALWNTDVHAVMVSEIIDGAVTLLNDALKKRSIVIRNEVASLSPFVRINRNHCIDLLVDILLNGAEAMDEGGEIVIDLRAYKLAKSDPKLNPRAKPGNYVNLRITDSGVGMTRETLEHVFEPFFTTKATETHVGLGLSVVYNAVQNYGGWIKVTSEPKQGATFSIFLPEAKPETRKASTQAARPTGSILVVDDDADTRALLHDSLKQAGFKVHMAATADEAIALYSEMGDQINLAIIDVLMPGRTGKDVLEALLKLNPTVAAIMLSGFSREHLRSFLPSGSWRFVQKPVDPDILLSAVRRTFEPKTP